MYKPNTPYNVPMFLHTVVDMEEDYGVSQKTYSKGILFYGSFRTFGGTERTYDGIYAVENTAVIETWYRPDIKSDCRISIPSLGTTYESLGKPENINMRNQQMKFKVIAIEGGA